VVENTNSYYTASFKKALKIMERTVVNNDEALQYNFYKYFFTGEGEVMETSKTEGHMIPLWRFSSEK